MLTETLKDLRDLRLGAMAACLQQWMDQPANHDRPSLECVEALVLAQKQDATNNRVQRFFREADLPMVCVAEVRPSAQRGLSQRLLSQLITCDWVRQGHQVVITGKNGAGKTFVVSALAREALLLKLGVTYWLTADMLEMLGQTPPGAARDKLFHSLSHVPLLILDHFAGQTVTVTQGYDLLKVLDSRRRKGKATLVASPNPFQDWDTYFEDATTADAVCSRLAQKVQLIELKPPKPPTKSA